MRTIGFRGPSSAAWIRQIFESVKILIYSAGLVTDPADPVSTRYSGRNPTTDSRGQRQHGQRKEVPVPGQSAQRHVEPGLVAESAEPEDPPPEPARRRSHGRGVQLRRRVQVTRSRCPEEGHRAGDDDVAGLVAGRLRPLRAALHPDGVAQCGHVPHQRRPRRCGVRRAALRAPEQLARQREPRQGATAAVADQEEVRPEDLVGRPDGLRRQLRPGVDGVQDVRLRRRARGCLGARGDQLGDREHVARRRALQRRPATRESARPPFRWASST